MCYSSNSNTPIAPLNSLIELMFDTPKHKDHVTNIFKHCNDMTRKDHIETMLCTFYHYFSRPEYFFCKLVEKCFPEYLYYALPRLLLDTVDHSTDTYQDNPFEDAETNNRLRIEFAEKIAFLEQEKKKTKQQLIDDAMNSQPPKVDTKELASYHNQVLVLLKELVRDYYPSLALFHSQLVQYSNFTYDQQQDVRVVVPDYSVLDFIWAFAEFQCLKSENQTVNTYSLALQLKTQMQESGKQWQQLKQQFKGHNKFSLLLNLNQQQEQEEQELKYQQQLQQLQQSKQTPLFFIPKLFGGDSKKKNAIAATKLPSTATVIAESSFIASCTLLDKFSESVVAQQLTQFDSMCTQVITLDSLIALKYSRKQYCAKTREVKYGIIDFENTLTTVVTSTVLAPKDASKRLTVFTKWIKVMDELLKLNNLHSIAVIVHGLRNSAIERLKKMKEKLTSAMKEKLEMFTELCDQSRSYRNMRQHLVDAGNADKPYFSYKFMNLQDLCFIEEGNPDTKTMTGIILDVSGTGALQSEVPNYRKLSMLKGVIKAIVKVNTAGYAPLLKDITTASKEALFELCNTTFAKDFDTLAYNKSLEIEPRAKD